MKLMTEQDKKKTNGGIAPMLLWVIIMGVTMAISTITHTTTSIIEAKHANSNQPYKKKSQYYASKQNNGYIRMSAYPSRSTMMTPI
ncbi:MAG: hypothetical protein LBF36_01800 [Mycoplasmataceae bacterium]|jgi:flagellar basal body-associated protein FliL|nr:hypothetical protein [Mycoplasmataceae bacterium]